MVQANNLQDVLSGLSRMAEQLDERVQMALEATGVEMVELARSYADETVPPVKKGEGRRKAHPGGWGDRTGITKNSFQSETAKETEDLHVLTITNSAESAEHLEKMDDYWVVSGLFDGGHVQEAFERHLGGALKAHHPEGEG